MSSTPKKTSPKRRTAAPSAKGATRSKAFREASSAARRLARHPERLKNLFDEAVRKARTIPKAPFKESWAYFQAMLRLLKAYYRGDYRDIPWQTMALIVAAIVYFVNPMDLIPDALFGLGFLDDAAVVGYALRSAKDDLDAFMAWEISEGHGAADKLSVRR
jgi:uncharacterized membrane protein YkvA (DUF1232 family)